MSHFDILYLLYIFIAEICRLITLLIACFLGREFCYLLMLLPVAVKETGSRGVTLFRPKPKSHQISPQLSIWELVTLLTIFCFYHRKKRSRQGEAARRLKKEKEMFSQIMNSFIASREKGGAQSGGISNERVLAANSDSRLRKRDMTVKS